MTSSPQRVLEFATWRPGYGGASVRVLRAGTQTLAPIYYDTGLTDPAPNPMELQITTIDGVSFGKFDRPIYTSYPYELEINSTDRAGVQYPGLANLIGQDASYATAKTARGSKFRRLIDRFDDVIVANDFGELADSPATNTATINAAIGAAAGQGGGFVLLPALSIEITAITLPQGVVLVGEGKGVTTLRSSLGQVIVTIGGNRAGMMNMTLDGLNLNPGSIGIKSEQKDSLLFVDCEVKRFATGMLFEGGRFNRFRDFDLINNDDGAKFIGKTAEWALNDWTGGSIKQHTGNAIELRYDDQLVRLNTFENILVDQNVDRAFKIQGIRFSTFTGLRFQQNFVNMEVEDGTDTSVGDANKSINLLWDRCYFDAGAHSFDDTSQDCRFDRCEFLGVTWDLTLPQQNILLTDPIEDSTVTVTGDGTKLLRLRRDTKGSISGVTTDAVATTAWSAALLSGQVALANIKAIAVQRNGTDRAIYYASCGAFRPGASLAYDNQTANFTVGTIVTGGTSGATARIIADADGGTTGTLTVRSIRGAFIDNEIITDTGGGSAQVNGVLSLANASLDTVGLINLRTAYETDVNYAVSFAVSGGDFQFKVQGVASETVEWTVEVDAMVAG